MQLNALFYIHLIHATFRQLRNGRFSPNLATKRRSVSRRGIQKDIFENFYFRSHLPPKSEIASRSNRHLAPHSEVTGCTAERYCLLYVVAQWPASFRDQVNFFVRRTVAERWGVKVAQFSDFGLFPIKTPKTYLPVTSLQLMGYIDEMIPIFIAHNKSVCPSVTFRYEMKTA